MTPFPELGTALKRIVLHNGLIMRIETSWFAVAPALITGESDIAEMCSLMVEPDGSHGTGRAPACHERCSLALLAATLVSGQAVGSGAENLTFAARGAAGKLHALWLIGLPEEVGRGAVFLASDEASFTTGSAVVVDGGFSTGLPPAA